MARKWQVQSGKRVRNAALGIAASAAMVAGESTSAAIVHNNNLLNNNLNNEGPVNNLDVDFDRDGTPDAQFVINNDLATNIAGLSLNPGPLNNGFGLLLPAVQRPLQNGDLVGPNNNFISNNANIANLDGGTFLNNEDIVNNDGSAFLGFNFNAEGAVNSPGTLNGWMRVQIDPRTLNLNLFEYAYETEPGKPIAVGAIPEPNTLALLATGVVGLLAWRRPRERRPV
jgi:hypothetical protein